MIRTCKTLPIAGFSLLLILTAGWLTFAQAEVPTGEIRDLNLSSLLMGRQMPYRVVLPVGYKTDPGKRYGVVYLLHGLDGHYNNWTERTRLVQYAAEHDVIIVAAEGADGWYVDSVSIQKDKYETYIVTELVPEIEKRFNVFADRNKRYIGGLSMGGYGAIKFGLKYPAMFSVVGSFSGALGAAGYNETTRGAVGRTVMSVFGPEGSEVRRKNDIFSLMRAVTPDRVKDLPFIYQACGTEDPFLGVNRDFVALLVEKKVPHEYRQHPGGHTWEFWDTHAREFLALVSKRVKK